MQTLYAYLNEQTKKAPTARSIPAQRKALGVRIRYKWKG
jgi:hypothetical protein